MTRELRYHYQLSKLAHTYNLLHFTFLEYASANTFSLTISKIQYGNCLGTILRNFNWNSEVAFISAETSFIKDVIPIDNLNYIYLENESNLEFLVNKVVSPLGSLLFYVFSNNESASSLVKIMASKKLIGSKSLILLNRKSSYTTNCEGSLIISEKGLEDVNDQEVDTKLIINILDQIISHFSTSHGESKNEVSLMTYMQSVYPLNFCVVSLSLINYHNGVKTLVGYTQKDAYISVSNITFPGGSLEIPKAIKKTIQFSVDSGSTNPNGVSPNLPNTLFNRATWLSVDDVNNSDEILTNF